MVAIERRNNYINFRFAGWSICIILVATMGKPLLSFAPSRLPTRNGLLFGVQRADSSLFMSEPGNAPPPPTTFREAEVAGLKLMQEGNFDQALTVFQKGLKLPGSRSDVVRTKALSGPSPVGGSMGGFDSQSVMSLDEFELQAANYNMACAHAQLGNAADALDALESAFKAGFDNFATVRGDPDLDPIKTERGYEKLMEVYEPKKGFNPFGLFGGK